MYAATTHRGAVRAVGSRAPAATPRTRLRATLLRHWREAQRCAALNMPTGTVKRGRA